MVLCKNVQIDCGDQNKNNETNRFTAVIPVLINADKYQQRRYIEAFYQCNQECNEVNLANLVFFELVEIV